MWFTINLGICADLCRFGFEFVAFLCRFGFEFVAFLYAGMDFAQEQAQLLTSSRAAAAAAAAAEKSNLAYGYGSAQSTDGSIAKEFTRTNHLLRST